MKNLRSGWRISSKTITRMLISILVLGLLSGSLLIPKLASSAKVIDPKPYDPYLPIVLNNVKIGPADTITPSPSATLTGTQPTATKTNTAGPSPTNTLTPSPTFTGTLTPVPALAVTVSPTSARIGENFVFTIKVGNTGTGPTQNNIVVNSYPTYLDVLPVTTPQGSVNKQTHSFIVSIGDIRPGGLVTIVATVRVNSTLTRTETITNIVALTYNEVFSKTASVSYQVIYQTLPGTGELPLNWRESKLQNSGMIPGFILIILGAILLLTVVIWTKLRESKYKLGLIIGSASLIVLGFILGAISFGIFTTEEQVVVYQSTPTNGNLAVQEPSATTLVHKPASAFSTPDTYDQLETLHDYPIPTPVITVTPQPGEVGPDTSSVTRIVIPALMLDTVVKYVPFDGVTWLISGLKQEVAWMGNTSWPGLGSNTGFAGHVTVAGMGDGPFRHLDELPGGELVLLYTENNIYTYQVRESKVTDDGDLSVVLPTDNAQISLITCVEWDDESRTYLKRLVVYADLVRSEPVTIGMAP
ncbi:MAG: sortase [Anaerolineae bacterium]|nr:sortase [Anaerolineae bacterium]